MALPPSPTPAPAARRIQRELLLALYHRHMRSGLSALLVVVTAFWALFYWHLRAPSVLIWAVLLYADTALLLAWYQRFWRWHDEFDRYPALLRQFYAVQAVSGLLWGLAPWWFVAPDDLPMNAVIVVVTMGLASASIGPLSAVRHGISACVAPMLLCVAAALLRQPDVLHTVLALFVVAHLVLVVKLANDHHAVLANAMTVRFEKEALAEQLGEQVAATERASAEKTRFLAAASHDLRQPLHAIALFGAALQQRLHQKGDLADERQAADLMRAVDALGQSFDTLLDISRLDAGVVVPAWQPVDLNALLVELHRLFSATASARELQLRIRATPLWVRSDPGLLLRVLSNLVDNALKYTPRGGVIVQARARDDAVWIDVRDTGLGVAEAQQERIFEEFYQVDNPGRDRSRGLGLGLPIVRRLAHLLGHTLQLRSRLGRGSCFRLLLTAAPPQPHLVASAGQAPAGPPLAPPGMPQRVLVLDDEDAVRRAMAELLASHGIAAHAVADEAAAHAALRRAAQAHQPFDVLVCDYRLADGADGLAAAQRLQRDGGHRLALLLVTGETSPERLRDVRAAGVAMLFKPVRADVLLRTLAGLGASGHRYLKE